MNSSETYLDIVWKQFRKNRSALAALWVLIFLFFLAVLAPLIGSDQPLVYHEQDGQTIYPWFHALFNTGMAADYFFNMALLALGPWLVGIFGWNFWAKRRGITGRRRAVVALLSYLALTLALVLVFLIPNVAPKNSFYDRTFPVDEFRTGQEARGIYVLVPFGPQESDLDVRQMPPLFHKSPDQWRKSNDHFIHLLGTDSSGRDVLVQILYGTRIALTVGLVAVGLYVTIGVVVGAVAGYFGGSIDFLMSRIIEVVLLFPSFFLILTMVGLLGSYWVRAKIYLIMIIIGITSWPTVARLIRGEVLKQRALDYTMSARALGAKNFRIIFRHILPNAIAPALVTIPFGIANAIVTEANLSLLGFGLSPPTPSWGYLLHIGSGNYALWWLILFPSVAIFITVTVFNLVGSGLRDAMDPRLRL